MNNKPYIIYIDDERPMLELVRKGLELAGYRAGGTTSGEQGLTMMREQKPALLLLDLMMPGLNGWEVYQAMKADEQLADIPVIAVTAKVPEKGKHIVEGLPPVEDYITKPFDIKSLIRAIRRCL